MACLGLRAKTGRAIAVVLAEGDDLPEVLHRGELALWDPTEPDSHQPHHAGLELRADEAARVVAAAEAVAARAAEASLAAFLEEIGRQEVTAVGVAGPPPGDVSRIGNPHVRAHAAEGQLFRRVLEEAAEARGLPWARLADRQPFDAAGEALACDPEDLKRQVGRLGAAIGPPWRADEKLACLAAWCVLYGS